MFYKHTHCSLKLGMRTVPTGMEGLAEPHLNQLPFLAANHWQLNAEHVVLNNFTVEFYFYLIRLLIRMLHRVQFKASLKSDT